MRLHRAGPGDTILCELVMLKCNKDLMRANVNISCNLWAKPLTFLVRINTEKDCEFLLGVRGSGRVGYWSTSHGSGWVRVGTPRLQVYPVLPVRKTGCHDCVTRKTCYWWMVRTSPMRLHRIPNRVTQPAVRSLPRCSYPRSMFSISRHRCMCLGTWNWHVGRRCAVVSIRYGLEDNNPMCRLLWSVLMTADCRCQQAQYAGLYRSNWSVW